MVRYGAILYGTVLGNLPPFPLPLSLPDDPVFWRRPGWYGTARFRTAWYGAVRCNMFRCCICIAPGYFPVNSTPAPERLPSLAATGLIRSNTIHHGLVPYRVWHSTVRCFLRTVRCRVETRQIPPPLRLPLPLARNSERNDTVYLMVRYGVAR